MFNRHNSYYVKYLLYLCSIKLLYNSLIVKVMEKEVSYHLFSHFGTCVEVSFEDYIETLKEARRLHSSYHVEVDKSCSSIWFVTLFNWK